MKANKSFLLGIFCCLFLCSCERKAQVDSISEYLQWFNLAENGFVKSKELNNLIFTVYYQPSHLLMAREIEEGKIYTSKELDSLYKEFQSSNSFVLEIESSEMQNLQMQVQQRLFNGEAGDIAEWVRLVNGQDTILPDFSHHEKGYELGARQRFLFSFPAIESTKGFTFIYNDKLYNLSFLKFFFNPDFNKIPELPVNIF